MGGKTTTSTNKVTIPQDVLDRYNSVNAQAQQVAQNPFQRYGENPEDFVAQFNEQQLKGVGGINAVAGMGAAYENVDKYLNPYIKNVADTTRAQMEQAQEQAQSGALGTAVSSGAFGGDRAGVAAANLANQNQMAMGSTMAGIYGEGYNKAIDTSMNDRNRMLGVAGAQLGAGTQMQQTEQAGKDALINQFMQEQGYPFQVAQFLANIAMGTGALSGSTTTSTQMAPFFSDRRLKHDIKKIGEADNGLPIYTFKYKGDEHHQTHVGFMADEVEKKNPEAVGLDPSGYKTVDYNKATESMGGAVKGYAEGGVAGPYGSKVGQGVGVGSYVPQAYLPVGELMVADPNAIAQSQSNFLDTLNSAATAGDSVLEFRDHIKKITADKARGGVVGGYAVGGGVQPQVHGDYMSSTLAAQAADKEKPELMTAQQQGQPKPGMENIASALGSIATIAKIIPFSDRRLKHDIKRIGETESGLPIYTFKYKGDDREQTHVGFMADEVERDHPEAVGKRDGYKTVDYSQAHKFATGGVAAGRHGYALDGTVEQRNAQDIRNALLASIQKDGDFRQPSPLDRKDIPAVQTLGSLPDANVVTAEAPRASALKEYAVGDDVFTRSNGLISDARGNPVPIELAPSVRGEIERQDRAYGSGLMAQSDEMKRQFEQSLADRAERNRNALTGMYGGVFPVSENAKAAQAGLAQAAMPALGAEDESARFYRMAAANRFNAENAAPTGVAPVAGQMRPKPRPEGLGAAAAPVIVGTTMTPAEKGSPFDLDRIAAATRLQESGSPSGNYGAIGKPVKRGDGFDYAYGAYGIMGANIPSWTEEILGKSMTPDEFLRDPQAQDIVAKAKLAEYHAKYGNIEDVASMWFSGRPFENNNSVDATSGKSVPSYVSDIVSNYYGGGVGPAANYDIASIPGGVAGNDKLSMSARDNRQEGGVKPYDERNTLGKIMYDEDGKLNKNAMLSLLAGFGDMVSSPSPFLLPAIGAGVAGAARTYMAREEQLADITKKNVENMGALYDLYNKFMFDHPELTGMTLEEFAEINGLAHMLPEPTGAGTGAGTGKITMEDTRSSIDAGNGITIPFMSDYASLLRLISEGKNAPEGSRLRLAADRAEEEKAKIEASGYTTGFKDGQPVIVPVDAARLKAGAILTDQQNVSNTQAFRTRAVEELPSIEPQISAVDRQIGIYSKLEAGILAEPTAYINALARGLGIEFDENSDQAALVQESLKEKARNVIDRGGVAGATDDVRNFVNASLAGPSLEPEAIKKLLAIEKASLLREKEHLTLHGEWQKTAKNPYDVNEYEAWFAQNYPLDGFIKSVEAGMPLFAGEKVTPENAPDGTTDNDSTTGKPIIKRNGEWVFQ